MPDAILTALRTYGKARQTVRLRYRRKRDGKVREYEIEPYSLRDRGTALYGYDVRDRRIKRFLRGRILTVRPTDRTFQPRWKVELEALERLSNLLMEDRMKPQSALLLHEKRRVQQVKYDMSRELIKLFDRHRSHSHHMTQVILDDVGEEANRIIKHFLGNDKRVVVCWDPNTSQFTVEAGTHLVNPHEMGA